MRLKENDKKWQIAVMIGLAAVLAYLLYIFQTKGGQNAPAYITLAVMVGAAMLFLVEIIDVTVIAMAVPILLALTGVITPGQAFQGFANDNVILFASMFIIGGAMFKTGLAERIGRAVMDMTKGSERLLLAGIAVTVTVTSAFLSNTGTVAVLLPVCMGIAEASGWSRKNLLMVLAMTASTGGMITLVGTPPNLTVNAVLEQYQYQSFGFLEFAWIGVPLSVLGGMWLVLSAKTELRQPGADKTNYTVSKEKRGLSRKEVVAAAVMAGVVAVMASGVLALHIAAAIGAWICVVCGLLTSQEAIESIDWTTIVLFAGMLVLAEALDQTGAGRMIADAVIAVIGENANEMVLLTSLFLLAVTLTQFMSNTASCALLAPIGIQIAEGLNANPRGALMVIAIASSSAFATPMATPPNTLVMGPGNLRMKDYLKTGIPLIVISYLVSIVIIPRMWPLYG